ncbi:hypothetical protein LZ30DRAFT_694497 [Colletotrichum cereale]|nr:hypothetical protein LZ30DRAFT_694497 [Colletotrichum cereale]
MVQREFFLPMVGASRKCRPRLVAAGGTAAKAVAQNQAGSPVLAAVTYSVAGPSHRTTCYKWSVRLAGRLACGGAGVWDWDWDWVGSADEGGFASELAGDRHLLRFTVAREPGPSRALPCLPPVPVRPIGSQRTNKPVDSMENIWVGFRPAAL